jgi:hypothetical protein
MKLPEPHHVYSMLWKEICRLYPSAARLAGLATGNRYALNPMIGGYF